MSPSKSASAVKISGDPLPNARIVTPARFSLKPITSERTANAGQKLKQNKNECTIMLIEKRPAKLTSGQP